jgi:threonine aldolase
VIFGLAAGAPDAATVVRRAAERGVLVFAFGPRSVRAVTHLDVTREQCATAADILAEAATATADAPAAERAAVE